MTAGSSAGRGRLAAAPVALPAPAASRWLGSLLLLCLLAAPAALAAPGGAAFPASVKDVAVSDDGRVLLSLSGELRLRGEAWRDFGFSAAPDRDDEFLLTRVLAGVELEVGEDLRAYVEAESALSFDRDLPGGGRTLDVDQLDLQQAYVDVALPTGGGAATRLLLGRQELSFGKQRLVSPLPWSNSQRSWDAARLVVTRDRWRGDAFYSRFAAVDKYDFNDWQQGPDFWGLYLAGGVGPAAREADLDLYYLGLDAELGRYQGGSGPETRHTAGARLGGKVPSGFDWDVEAAYQWGEVGSRDVEAHFVASELGWTHGGASGTWRLHLRLDRSSGDERPGDGELGTFNALFPLGHAYHGYMDFVGRQNLVDVAPGVTWKPTGDLTLLARFHGFRRASDGDGLYNAGGGLVRAGGPADSREIGQELDLVATWKAAPRTTLEAGYGHFFAGDFLAGGPDRDMDWLYLQAQVVF